MKKRITIDFDEYENLKQDSIDLVKITSNTSYAAISINRNYNTGMGATLNVTTILTKDDAIKLLIEVIEKKDKKLSEKINELFELKYNFKKKKNIFGL